LNQILTPGGRGSGNDLAAAVSGNCRFITESGAVSADPFVKIEDVVVPGSCLNNKVPDRFPWLLPGHVCDWAPKPDVPSRSAFDQTASGRRRCGNLEFRR
jgi:hypothetical protein